MAYQYKYQWEPERRSAAITQSKFAVGAGFILARVQQEENWNQ
jgi:hypothetical protein